MRILSDNPQQIDLLNIGAIVVSAVLAYLMPFQLFLFSYAILGPLHYLTEIGWLDQKGYYIRQKSNYKFFVVMAVIYSLSVVVGFLPRLDATKAWMAGLDPGDSLYLLLEWLKNIFPDIVFITFAAAMSFLLAKKAWMRWLWVGIAVLLAIWFHGESGIQFIAIFLPTLIHVSIFTFLFMLSGALRSGSRLGLLACALMLACSLLYFVLPIDTGMFLRKPDAYTISSLESSSFDFVNYSFAELLGFNNALPGKNKLDYGLEITHRVQCFIAFSYTYHYLNWFSKTGIIKWHKVKRGKLLLAVGIWLCAIVVYAIDYKIGLLSLLFLSMLHVFMEFPLNIVSIRNLIGQLRVKS